MSMKFRHYLFVFCLVLLLLALVFFSPLSAARDGGYNQRGFSVLIGGDYCSGRCEQSRFT
ncbi:MAG: hypothetical protein NTV00_02090 [Methylococcales bacterium]|nr:hypothetical protein [Methylococcales bacterium]